MNIAREHTNGDKQNSVIKFKFRESDISQRWLITTEFCPVCGQAKKDNKTFIKSGILKVIDVGEDKGFEMLTELGLDALPAFVIELREGFPVRYLLDE